MSCKGCETRKGKIRKWLGIDAIMTKQGEYFTEFVYRQLKRRDDVILKLHLRIEKLEAK